MFCFFKFCGYVFASTDRYVQKEIRAPSPITAPSLANTHTYTHEVDLWHNNVRFTMNHSQKVLEVQVEFLSNYWLLVFFLVLLNKVASLQSSLRFLKVVCLSCSKLDLHLPDDFHIRLLSSTLHFLRLLELNKNSVNETPKNTDSQSRMTEIVLVEQGKGSWSDDVVEQGYCLLASLFEGCEPVLLPELLDGLGDEIVSCLLYPY